MKQANVGEVRQQSALMSSDEPVVVRLVGDDGSVRYYRVRTCWPDGMQAPVGSAFYVEAFESERIQKGAR